MEDKMGITASQVKELREKTGVGMMDCKKALNESDGDIEKAVEFLRKKGLAKAAKRSDRSTDAGLIDVMTDGKTLAILELKCETDFVAKNDDFLNMSKNLTKMVLESNPSDLDALNAMPYAADTSKTVSDVMAEALAKIGESLKIGRFNRMIPVNDPGELVHYIHTGSTIGVVVDFAAAKPDTLNSEAFKNASHDIALHITAAAPMYLLPDAVPSELIEKEKEIYMEEAKGAGKPEKILEKIAMGKLNRFYKDNCLLKQDFVKDNDVTIEQLLKNVSKDVDDEVTIKSFLRYKIGEEG